MKTLVLGDTHGRPHWKEIVAKEQPHRVIFIGDYFDSYDDYTAAEQIHNFKEIIEWKHSGQAAVIILVGNHDFHYLDSTERYSGFQAGAAPAINQVLMENEEHLQMAYQMGEFLFSHAGISRDWLMIHGWSIEHNIVDWVNELWKFTPRAFKFAGGDPYGDSVVSSPIWIRPKSLQRANHESLRNKYIQVVGHTQQRQIDREGKSTGGRYYYIDALGTSGEYMIIEDNKVSFDTWKKN